MPLSCPCRQSPNADRLTAGLQAGFPILLKLMAPVFYLPAHFPYKP